MGLLDSLKVRKMSYPFRFKYPIFFKIYQDLDMGEHGARNYNSLVEEKANFIQLTKELVQYCDIEHNKQDLLYGKTRIFLNEKFKIVLDKALLIKQEKKKVALAVINKLFQ